MAAPDTAAEEKLFLSIGLEPKKAKDTPVNRELADRLKALITAGGISGGADRAVGSLMYALAATKGITLARMTAVAPYIGDARIATPVQLKAALEFLAAANADTIADPAAFAAAAGVGVTVSDEQIAAAVKETLAANPTANHAAYGKLLGGLMKADSLKFADGTKVGAELERALVVMCGPKPTKGDKTAAAAAAEPAATSAAAAAAAAPAAALVTLTKPETPYTRIPISKIKEFIGKRVLVCGWAHHIREGDKKHTLTFVELRDGTEFVQVVLTGQTALAFSQQDIRREASLKLWGTVTQPPEGKHAKWTGVELQSDYYELVGNSPMDLEHKLNVASGPNVLFDQRHIHLRGERASAYLKARSYAMQSFREHYFSKGYFEVTPPTMVQTMCEGGAELFEFDFYGEKAYLTQSSQLYLETVLPCVGNTFCIAQSYRAEKAHTRRHLSEFTHVEAELSFIDFEDLLVALEDLLCDVYERINKYCGPMLDAVNKNRPTLKRPFKRMTYLDALAYLKEHEIYKDEATKTFYEFGDDIPEAPERKMVDAIGEPVLLMKFTVEMKAFYMRKCKDDPRLTESVDLCLPGVGEVIGGSMRIDDYDELMAAYAREKLDPTPYYWFTEQRKYGTVPHGGYGLGMERFMTWLTGEEHIRNVCLYPRYEGRCTP